MIWLIVAVIVGVVGFIIKQVTKTGRMNDDPVQKELAELIMEMMEGEATPDAQALFVVSSNRALMMRMIDPREFQTRYVHALTMCKPFLNAEGFAVATRIVRSIA